MSLNPANLDAKLNLAKLLIGSWQYPEAQAIAQAGTIGKKPGKLFEKPHAIDPNSAYVSAELAFLYLEQRLRCKRGRLAHPDGEAEDARIDDRRQYSCLSCYKLGSTNLAIAQLKESVAKTPGKPRLSIPLGNGWCKRPSNGHGPAIFVGGAEGRPEIPQCRAGQDRLARIGQQNP